MKSLYNKSKSNKNNYLYHKTSSNMTDEPPDDHNNNNNNHKISAATTTTSQMYKYQIEYPFKTINHKTTNNLSIFKIFKLVSLFLVNLILMLPILVYLAFIYPLNESFKCMFKLFHLCHLTKTSMLSPHRVPEFLRPMELFWLYTSSLIHQNQSKSNYDNNNNNKNICSCIVFVEGQLNKKSIKDLIQNRIIASNNRTGQRYLVRFTQRLYRLFAYYYVWLDCGGDESSAAFNLDNHITEIDDHLLEMNTQEQLQNYVAQLISTSHEFRLDKPLWHIYFKKTFGSGADQTTVLIFLFHMCFADGISLIRLFFKTVVDNRNTIDIKSRFAFNRFKFDMIRQFFFSFNKIFYYLFVKKRDNNPLNRETKKNFKNVSPMVANSNGIETENNKQQKQQVLRWSEPFSLVLINRLKLVTRSKLNDFFISVVAGIIREYLQKNGGINNPKNLHCLMPINLKSNRIPFDLSNETVLSSIKLPTNIEGTIPRLWSTKMTTNKLKYSSNYLFLYLFVCILFNALPHWLAVRLIRYLINKNTLIASTLGAGDNTLSTVSLCNKNVRNILFVYPTLCKLSISFSIITYGDEVRLCLLADSDIIKHPEQITHEFIKQLETLNYLLANRRMPGEIRRGLKTNANIIATATTMTGINNNNNNINKQISTASSSTMYPITNKTIVKMETLENLEEMQLNLNKIHNELQTLTDIYSNLDSSSADFNKQKQQINYKKEYLKKEFRQILHKLQVHKNSIHKTIPSDDEDELDPKERVRLRSSSIVSKISSHNNSKKLNSGRASISYSRQNSHASITNSASGYLKSNSNVNIRNEIVETSSKKSSEHQYSNRLN